MKRILEVIVILAVLAPTLLCAEDFLGAPILPGGTVVSKTEARLEKNYDMSYEDAIALYKEALKGQEEIKFRDRGDQTFIEEHSNRPWHSITISKRPEGGVTIVHMKDNWTWILGTLVLRFFGVFAVLLVLYIALAIAGAIVSRSMKSKAAPA